MNKFYVIGIGYRPLEEKASYIIKRSDMILATERLLDVFRRYSEFNEVREKLKVTADIHETIDCIRGNYETKKVSVLADGDPMFFGFGRMAVKEFDKEAVEILPDLSSVQVAFSRIKEPWGDAFLMSLHGGPDPDNRRKPEYDLQDIPKLLDIYGKIGILTDRVNNPSAIAEVLNSSLITHSSSLSLYVCERLGYPDEKVTEGTPEEMSKRTFSYPNVVIILKKRESRP
jgi:precorrin-6Y C5,15-methyltransferase (decarboxylating)